MVLRSSISWIILTSFGILTLCVVVMVGIVSGKTITVDDDGGADYDRIQDALYRADDDDIVRVYEGTYNERFTIKNRISLIGNGSANTTITYNDNTCITVNANSVTIRNFTIMRGTYRGDTGIHLNGGSCEIVNNTIMNWFYGIFGNGSGSNEITSNIYKHNRYGVYFDAMHWQCSGNDILMNEFTGCDFGAYFMAAWGSANYNFIGHNIFTKVSDTAIIFYGYSRGNVIAGNRITENGRGIQLVASGYSNTDWPNENTIEKNIIMDNRNSGIEMKRATLTDIRNNTIIGNKKGILITEFSPENTARNNYFLHNMEYGVDSSYLVGDFINITDCWWGDDSGPYHPLWNSDGKGDAVTNHTVYTPWKTLPVDYFLPFVSIEDPDPIRSLSGENVSFNGQVIPYDRTINYVWKSSLDGELYNGSELYFATNELSNGTHNISLKVSDNYGYWSDDVIINFEVLSDVDEDGIPDIEDVFPENGNEWNDIDEDGVGDNSDAFPTDPAASMDYDGDGYPDDFHWGYSESDSTTGLKRDHYPDDPEKWKNEKDNGGFLMGFEFMILIISMMVSLTLKRISY